MKKKISVSIEEGTIRRVNELVETGIFRCNSHLIELAINKFIKK